MVLRELLAGVDLKAPLAEEFAMLAVTGLDYDSRRMAPGQVFFAFPGARADGRQFASAAIARGAAAVVSDLPPPEGFSGPWIEVVHGRQALAVAARNFYQAPDLRLQITGITGTN